MSNSVVNIPRVLVTGDHGFVGSHALRMMPGAVGLSDLAPNIDVRNKVELLARLRENPPENVLHLAALSFVPDSFKAPEATFEVNFLGTLRLLEALAETGFKGRFLFVSTGDAYGRVQAKDLPILETLPLRPLNPYAVSKAAAEALCFQWSQTAPFEVIVARPFNHIGAGQASTFAISDFARQIAGVASGKREPVLRVGNIDVTRDFTDVRDVVRAYALLLESGQNGEIYNVCSGTERTVRSLVERLLSIAGIHAEIVNDSVRFRPSDQPRVCGSNMKLLEHTGWQPILPIDETLSNLYRYWENKNE